MAFTKYAKASILEVRRSPERLPELTSDGFEKLALADPKISEDGYLYVQVRAISSRVNKNNDGWPSEELAKSYKTFKHRPIFVDHNNDNPGRTRGVITSSILHVDDMEKAASLDPYYSTAPDNHKPPTWIELLLEVDAKSFPKLADAIVKGEIDAVSMGANIDKSICSVCSNTAKNPSQYCDHIQNKGVEFEIESATGETVTKLAYEDCHGINFFEISFVFDPADTTALINDVRKEAVSEIEDEDDEDGIEEPPAESPGDAVAVEPPTRENEAERVIAWRMEQLERLGFPPEFAAEIAKGGMIDWHDIEALMDQGATREVAYDIVSKRVKSKRAGTTSATLAAMDDDFEKVADEAGGMYELNDQSERKINYEPQSDQLTAPEEVDTLREEHRCPQCESEMNADKTVGALICDECGFEQQPEGFDNPDLSLHHTLDNGDVGEVAPDATVPTGEALAPEVAPEPNSMAPESPIKPVSPVNAISKNESTAVISDMKFTVKHRFVTGAADDNKVIISDPNKKGTDEPQGTKIVSDQLAPVEANQIMAALNSMFTFSQNEDGEFVFTPKEAEMNKETDREVIKRVEEDGQGVKRTEEIVKEFGPMGDSAPEGLEGETEEGDEPTSETGDESAPTDDFSSPSDPSTDSAPSSETDSTPSDEEDKNKWSSEHRLFAALKLAKLASELGLITSDDELTFVGEMEDETMVQIEARFDTLTRVKEAGLAKKRNPITARRASFPSLPKVAATSSTDDDTPFEALFL